MRRKLLRGPLPALVALLALAALPLIAELGTVTSSACKLGAKDRLSKTKVPFNQFTRISSDETTFFFVDGIGIGPRNPSNPATVRWTADINGLCFFSNGAAAKRFRFKGGFSWPPAALAGDPSQWTPTDAMPFDVGIPNGAAWADCEFNGEFSAKGGKAQRFLEFASLDKCGVAEAGVRTVKPNCKPIGACSDGRECCSGICIRIGSNEIPGAAPNTCLTN